MRKEDEGEVWATAYIPIMCLKTHRYGNCSYKYEVLVVFRLHFGKCNLRSDRCSVGDQGVLSRLSLREKRVCIGLAAKTRAMQGFDYRPPKRSWIEQRENDEAWSLLRRINEANLVQIRLLHAHSPLQIR